MIGKSLTHYKILEKLGEGGMGVVFRAHDSKLHREVAIKILPEEMSGDPERAARFAREARMLASLQHANIASVYGYEEADGVRFLVMELIDGEDLHDRLSRGAVPLDDAIDIATHIAAGLEAAHDQNIVHRDLKPANIKVAPSGEVKILDFGLACAYLGDENSDPNLSQSPTITAAMTSAGVILGTAAYMSPEQARGKPVDKRSDLWAFGVILFEMLTGTRLFAGETVSDTLAAVLREEPNFDLLPKPTSPSVRRLLRRCLQRDPRMRIRSAGDATLELTDTEEVAVAPAAKSAAPRWVWLALGVLAVALAVSVFMRPDSAGVSDSDRSLHLDITLPGGLPIGPTAPSLSPDGKWLAFAVRDTLNRDILYLRSLERFNNELAGEIELRHDADVGALFWSPDSRQLGIQTSTNILTMNVATRMIQKIADGMAFARGAAWASDGTILYAPGANTGLFALKSFGDSPREITAIDTTRADASHRWPVFLPDGERFLFTTWSNAAEEQDEIGGIYLGALDGRRPVRILKGASQVLVDPAGYLLFHRTGKLMQVPFDFDAAETRGEPMVVADNLSWNASNGLIMASASGTGDLVLAATELASQHTIGWLDRDGDFTSLLDVPGGMFGLHLSPSGRHAAIDRLIVGSSVEIWIADLDRRTLSLLSRFGSDCWGGAFSPDGTQYVYTSQDPGFERLYAHGIDGATDPTQLVDLKSVSAEAGHWSDNGQLLFSHRPRTSSAREIWVYDFSTGESASLLADDFSQDDPMLSPDGRWLAYSSDESGRSEVYVRPYPALNRKWQISTEGGARPYWRGDGKQLLYLSRPGRAHAVQVKVVGDELEISNPYLVASFDRKYNNLVPDTNHERFLCGMVEGDQKSMPFRFISNWRAKLESSQR